VIDYVIIIDLFIHFIDENENFVDETEGIGGVIRNILVDESET